jgi:hypothetical protein
VCNLKKSENNNKWKSAKNVTTVSSKLIFKSFGKEQNFS